MNGLVAGVGLGLLIMFGTLAGHALDRGARDAAWRQIASARHVNHETARHLTEWAADLEMREKELDVREWRLDRRERGHDLE